MKIIKKTVIGVLAVFIASTALLYATGNGFIVTSVKRTYLAGEVTANINDHIEFDTKVINTSTPQILAQCLFWW